MNALIIDDDIISIKTLENALLRYCPLITAINYTTSPEEGISLINSEKPRILFIDVNMPGYNGLDIIEGMPNTSDIDIVVGSGYSEYALRALRLSVTDYLIKPVSPLDLLRVMKKIEQKRGSSGQPTIEADDNKDLAPNGKIAVQLKDGIQFIDINEIVMAEALGSYSKLHLTNKTNITVTKNLKQIENILGKYNFFRAHRSSIINISKVSKYKPLKDGGIVSLTNGLEIELSRTQKERV